MKRLNFLILFLLGVSSLVSADGGYRRLDSDRPLSSVRAEFRLPEYVPESIRNSCEVPISLGSDPRLGEFFKNSPHLTWDNLEAFEESSAAVLAASKGNLEMHKDNKAITEGIIISLFHLAGEGYVPAGLFLKEIFKKHLYGMPHCTDIVGSFCSWPETTAGMMRRKTSYFARSARHEASQTMIHLEYLRALSSAKGVIGFYPEIQETVDSLTPIKARADDLFRRCIHGGENLGIIEPSLEIIEEAGAIERRGAEIKTALEARIAALEAEELRALEKATNPEGVLLESKEDEAKDSELPEGLRHRAVKA